ncbi:MAG: HAD hydrolase family protein, partial [Phycisphaerales bacterium]|nr:HAD hydrolase family protein [Phycisphaerales bacterium]
DNIYSGVSDKSEAFSDLLEKNGVDASQVAMVGDDLPDLPILRRCGYAVAVNDGVQEVRDVARFVTQANGGQGAVREVIEHLLRAKGRWEEAVAIYDLKSEAR